MRAQGRLSVVACLTAAAALTAAVLALPPQPQPPPPVTHEVQLAAAPALGAIPLAFIRNQFQYCSLICPYAVQGAITVPIGAVQAPATFLDSLASTGSLFKAFGAAAASVTGPANAAVTPLINNDVFLVVPKAFHALDVAVVEAFNVGGGGLDAGSVPRCDPERAHQHSRRTRSAGGPTDYPDRCHQHIAGGGGRGDQRCDGGGVSGG